MGNFSSSQPSVYIFDKLFDQHKSSSHSSHQYSQTHSHHHVQPLRIYNGIKTKQGNIFWTGISSLSYQNFKRHFLHNQNLKFKHIQNQKLVVLRALDNPEFYKSNLYKNQVYFKNGIESEIINIVNKQIKQLFPQNNCHDMKQHGSNDRIVTYAYLHKILKDKIGLFNQEYNITWYGKNYRNSSLEKDLYHVKAFGTTKQQTLKQLKIINYSDQHHFLIGFQFQNLFQHNQKKQSKQKQKIRQVIYIYVNQATQQKQTFKSVIQKILKIEEQKPFHQRPHSNKIKQFIMPVLDFDIKHKFKDFHDLEIQNEQLYGKRFKMIEHIRLKIIEQSSLVIELKKQQKSKNVDMINRQQGSQDSEVIKINRPFWIILTKQGEHPYLVAKINQLHNSQVGQNEQKQQQVTKVTNINEQQKLL